MNSLHQHIGCNENLLVLSGIIQDSAVITYTVESTDVLRFEVFCKMVYKPEFSKFRYFGTFCLWHITEVECMILRVLLSGCQTRPDHAEMRA